MCSEDIQRQILEVLTELNSDKYEYSDPLTIGGSTGQYFCSSPYNTECEWCLVSVSCGNLAGGSFAIGSKIPKQPTLFAGGDSFGSINASGNFNPLSAYAGNLSANASFISQEPIWIPLGMPCIIYATFTVNAQSEMLATLQFRRKLLRIIPDMPRPKPHTHTHPISRANLRRLQAASPMVTGFASRTIPGEEYQHAGIAMIPERNQGLVPVSQDTVNLSDTNRGMSHGAIMGRMNKKRG